jgi:hypothetical protein
VQGGPLTDLLQLSAPATCEALAFLSDPAAVGMAGHFKTRLCDLEEPANAGIFPSFGSHPRS